MGSNQPKVKLWIQYAEVDLACAIELADSGEKFYGVVLFHAQQCAEKALKALIVLQEMKVPKTHSFNVILEILEDTSFFEAKWYTLVKAFDDFTNEVRYPGIEVEISLEDVAHGISSARAIIESVKRIVNKHD